MIAIPGKTSQIQSLESLQMMALVWSTRDDSAVRLIPVIGKDVGDAAEFVTVRLCTDYAGE